MIADMDAGILNGCRFGGTRCRFSSTRESSIGRVGESHDKDWDTMPRIAFGGWDLPDRHVAADGVRLRPVTIGAHMQRQSLKERVRRRLACMNYAFGAGVRCPRCKASFTEKLPGIALGFITSCPHCGLSFTEPM